MDNFHAGVVNWRLHNPPEKTAGTPFYVRSSFGSLFNEIAESIIQENQNVCTRMSGSLEKNPFYSSKFFSYLQIKILPFCVCMTKIPFHLGNLPIQDDNTNTVEYFHKIVENDILQKKRQQRITRVIRTMADNVLGS